MKKQMNIAEYYDYMNAGRKKCEKAYNAFIDDYCKVYGLSMMKEAHIICMIALKDALSQVK